MEQPNKSPAPLTAKDLAVAFKLDFQAGERFCFILGSGASRNSGIKTGLEMIGEWREELLKNYGGDMSSIRRAAERLHYAPEEWEPVFVEGYKPDSRHYFVMYDLMYARTMRAGYDYMEKAMAKARPSIGYYCLASILNASENRSNLVITTNFDTLTEDALFFYSGKHPLVLGHERMASFLRSDTDRPIVAKIHRDMLLEPMSRQEEMRKLKEEWSKALRNVLPNCIPIVIGYAGGDNTLMDLLKDESLKCRKLYWCSHISQDTLDPDAAAVIANHSGEWVQIPGFDELLFQMANNLELVPGVEELRASTEARIQQYEKTYEKFITPYLNPVVVTKSETIAAKVEDEPASAQTDDTAQAVIREETRRNPGKSSEILSINEAWKLWYTDSQEAAISKLTEEIQSNPDAAMVLNARGIMYRRLGRYDEALQDATRAVKLEPGNAQFHYGLGLTLHEMKQLEPALTEIECAIALDPTDSYFYAGKASVLLDMNILREAKKAVEIGIRLNRGNAYCHAVRSQILLRLGSREAADQAASMAIDIAPYLPSGQFAKSAVLYKKKQYKEALEHIDKALEVWPDFDDYLNHREKILNAINSQK